MKKTLYSIAVLCMGLFTSCAEEMFEDNTQQAHGDLIEFTLANVQTRMAQVNTSNIQKDFDTWHLYAAKTEATDATFKHIKIDPTTVKTEKPLYWPATVSTYDFYVAPDGMEGVTPSGIGQSYYKNGVYTFDYTAPEAGSEGKDGENAPDLVFARVKGEKGKVAELTFEHALASVQFVYQTPKIAHKVKSIEVLNAYAGATCTVNKPGDENMFLWNWPLREDPKDDDSSPIITRNYIQTFDNGGLDVDLVQGQELGGLAAAFTLIPATGDTTGDNQELTFKVTMDDNKTCTATYKRGDLNPGQTLTVKIVDNELVIPEEIKNYLGISKKYTPGENGKYNLTLETYVTGENHTIVKTKPADIAILVDVSGSMAFNMNNDKEASDQKKSRMGYTKTAINSFIDQIVESAGDHRVALATFASNTKTVWNWAEITSENKQTYTDYVKGLKANGGTQTGAGMELVKNLFDNAPQREDGEEAQKVLVFITDGEPGNYIFNGGVANTAINDSKYLKDNNVIVWSVFVGNDITEKSTDVQDFMQGMSSNYPNASSILGERKYNSNEGIYYDYILTLGTKASDDYFVNAKEPSDLEKVFTMVAESAGQADLVLDENTKIQDVLSSVFTLPADAKPSDIKLYTVNYQGNGTSYDKDTDWDTANKKLVANDTDLTDAERSMTPTISDDKKTFSVVGFNFSKYFCGSRVEGVGKKLVIEVTGLTLNNTDKLNHFTNGAGSGLIVGEEFYPFNSWETNNLPTK